MDTTTHLMPLGALSRRLGIPATWLRLEAQSGRIPHLQAGRSLLFDYPTVEQLLRERAQQRPDSAKEGDHA